MNFLLKEISKTNSKFNEDIIYHIKKINSNIFDNNNKIKQHDPDGVNHTQLNLNSNNKYLEQAFLSKMMDIDI